MVHIDGRQIRKDNVDEVWADLKEKTGKKYADRTGLSQVPEPVG